jgi:spore coat polysaccharide biosynthesis predicted glycosyltransferase SpsG
MGGTDPDNVTQRVLGALLAAGIPGIQIRIIMGRKDVSDEEVLGCHGDRADRISIYRAVNNMSEHMAWADMAVTSGGGTVWELAFMGVPSVVGCVSEAERYLTGGLSRLGLFETVGDFSELNYDSLADAISALADDQSRRREMMMMGRDVVDGKGCERVISALISTIQAKEG